MDEKEEERKEVTIDKLKNDPELLKQKRKTETLDDLTKEELISRVVSLEKHVKQLRNVIAKNSNSEMPEVLNEQKTNKKKFEFAKFKRRHVLLKVCYFGWDYMGFAVQEDAGKTIESELFAALLRTRLIESRQISNYHRCGRTDRGVSAFSQVISLDLRTNLSEGDGIFTPEEYTGNNTNVKSTEIDYCHILNRNLPDDIKVTAWAPAPILNYSARFDCEGRTYRYFFPRGGLDITRMEAGGSRLLGEHDFRNFCKMDVNNGVVNYMRRIDQLTVTCVLRDNPGVDSPYDMCQLTIVGKAYLWHQIRCIVSVLFLVGEGKEETSVIDELLDVKSNPCRPSYGMASDLPLNLFDCQFNDISWQYDQVSHAYVLRTFQKLWSESSVRTQMIRSCLEDLDSHAETEVKAQVEPLSHLRREKVYTPLMKMPRCPSLEDKIATVAKRRKIEIDEATLQENDG